MKSVKRILALILSTLILLSLFAACGGEKKDEAAGAEKSVTVGTTYAHLYFYTSGAGESDNYCRRLVYDQLFYVDDYTGEMSSDLLESYEWENDTTLKLVLKDNVTFSDGTKMTGNDILATLKSYIDNGNSETEFFKRIDFAKSVVDADGLTTRIVYTEVYGAAISTLIIPILPAAAIEKYPDGEDYWWYEAVGSGPYKVGEVTQGTSVEYVLRDDYWNKDKTYEAEKITVKYYSDATAEYADFVAGNLDAMIQLTTAQVEQLEGEKDVTVVKQSAHDVAMICFNEATVPEAVRQAVAYGVDWEAMAAAGYGVLYTPATSHFATTFEAYSDHSGAYTYDVAKAKQILADAGISGLTLSIPCFGGAVTDIDLCTTLQFYLKELGIELKIDQMDIPTLIPTLISGGGDLSIQSTTANGNAPKEVNTVLSPMAAGGFAIMALSDPAWNDLLTQGLNTTDPAARAALYKQADQWLYDNFQGIPIAERGEAFAFNSAKIATMNLGSTQRGNLACITFK